MKIRQGIIVEHFFKKLLLLKTICAGN